MSGKLVMAPPALGGRVLLVGGKLALSKDCCWPGAPCWNVAQPDVVVSVSGTCGYGCDSAPGTYEFDRFDGTAPEVPKWYWENSHAFLLRVEFDRENCNWLVWIYGTVLYEGNPYEIQFGDPDHPIEPPLIDCDPETGFITGAFNMPGQWLWGSYDCHLCVAQVTLG
jgi:hypothetical protein